MPCKAPAPTREPPVAPAPGEELLVGHPGAPSQLCQAPGEHLGKESEVRAQERR